MTNRIPPLRDLPPGRHDDRRTHLLGELRGPGRRLYPTFSRPTMRVAGFAVAGAVALILAVSLGARHLGGSSDNAPVAVGPPLHFPLTGPGATVPSGGALADCIGSATYGGRVYWRLNTYVRPTAGGVLHGAEELPCNDNPATIGQHLPGTRVAAAAIEGVSPALAFMVVDPDASYVYVRSDHYNHPLSAALTRLTTPLVCSAADGPIVLTGRAYSLDDPTAPAGLRNRVLLNDPQGTPDRYSHVQALVYVPAGLAQPLETTEGQAALSSGTARLTARCDDGKLIATRIDLSR